MCRLGAAFVKSMMSYERSYYLVDKDANQFTLFEHGPGQVPRIGVSAAVVTVLHETVPYAIIVLQKMHPAAPCIKFNPLLVPNRTKTWFRST